MRTPQRRFAAVFMALALLATACGGASEPLTPEAAAAAAANASATEAAAAAAEANIQLLAGGTTPFDFEVLNVHDGSISSVEEVVDGDRAVLLWFFSPH